MFQVKFWFKARGRDGAGTFFREEAREVAPTLGTRVRFPEDEGSDWEVWEVERLAGNRELACHVDDDIAPRTGWPEIRDHHTARGWSLAPLPSDEDEEDTLLEEGEETAAA